MVESVRLSDLAREHDTPLFVYSKAAMLSALAAYQRGFAGRKAQICYAMKANSTLAVLQVFAEAGCGFDTVSGGELARVLAYPQIAKRLTHREIPADTVLGHFDRWAQLHPDAPKAEYVCKDPDDQKFIDLAVTHTAALHSKDAQVLCMKNRLARCGVVMNPALAIPS